MAQHNGVKPTGLPPTTTSSSFAPLGGSNPTSASNGSSASDGGVNAELLMSMMNCVDTSLFSSQQLHNWEQMKLRIKLAAEQNTPLAPDVVQDFIVKNTPKAATSAPSSDPQSQQPSVDYRQPLHREASIQDVLACLLDQQAPTSRTMSSSGGSFLINSEVKNRAQHSASASSSGTDESKPTLKSLLSSNDFSMTEKKESLRHLLSFIDNSFAATAEPLTQVYKDCEEGTLQRLSSLQLMRSFMTPTHPANAHAMGRTTSFEIIQAMLNATSNQAIQKPMSSQDSFRFQHLARTLESIESDVGYDNEDYGGDDVVQVDNLDNLLDYHGPTTASSASAAPSAGPSSATNPHVGFVDTQTLVNPTRSIYNEYGAMAPSAPYPPQSQQQSQQQQQQSQYGQSDPNGMYPPQYNGAAAVPSSSSGSGAPSAMFGDNLTPYQQQQQQLGAAQNMLKLEHGATQHHALQQQLLQQQHKFQQQQHNPFQYQSAMLAQQQQANSMLLAQVGAGAYSRAPDAQQQQQYAAMLLQQQAQQTPFHGATSAQRIPVPLHAQALSQVKQHKQDAAGGAQICSALGCNHPARVKGMCKLHGGGRRCKVDGCMKSAQTGHLCIAHGGGKPCNVEGCPKTAQSRGLCKQHGGGVRCKFEGCTKSCQSGGFCRGHGGGKRCEFPNCTKWAQKNGHCAKHAQELTQKSATSHP